MPSCDWHPLRFALHLIDFSKLGHGYYFGRVLDSPLVEGRASASIDVGLTALPVSIIAHGIHIPFVV